METYWTKGMLCTVSGGDRLLRVVTVLADGIAHLETPDGMWYVCETHVDDLTQPSAAILQQEHTETGIVAKRIAQLLVELECAIVYTQHREE